MFHHNNAVSKSWHRTKVQNQTGEEDVELDQNLMCSNETFGDVHRIIHQDTDTEYLLNQKQESCFEEVLILVSAHKFVFIFVLESLRLEHYA